MYAFKGAILCLTTCIGNLITPYVITRVGPKNSFLFIISPIFTLQWILILLSRVNSSVWLILAGRGVAGISFGVTLGVVPSYIIEISSMIYHGIFALGPQLMMNLGLVFVFIVGAVTNWWWLSLSCLTIQLPIISFFVLVPDSPHSLIMRGHREKSETALFWLSQSKQSVQEKIKTTSEQGCVAEKKKNNQLLYVLQSLRSRNTLKPLCVSISLLLALQLCGFAPLIFFSVK